MEKKQKISPEELCKGIPEEFMILLKYARNIGFEERPDYKNMKLMFSNLLKNSSFKNDGKFDWEDINLDKEEFVMNELKKKK